MTLPKVPINQTFQSFQFGPDQVVQVEGSLYFYAVRKLNVTGPSGYQVDVVQGVTKIDGTKRSSSNTASYGVGETIIPPGTNLYVYYRNCVIPFTVALTTEMM